MKQRKIISAAVALCLAAPMTACGGSDSSTETEAEITTTAKTEWTGDNIEVTVASDALDTDVDISGKTLKYLGITDINPTNDQPERSAELTLFEDTYGASVEWRVTTSANRFNDLATSIMSGDSPDIFIYEWLAFPYGISKGQYQPIDSIIDWDDPMWASVKDVSDMYIYNGEHYIVPYGYDLNNTQVLMYNSRIIEEQGFDDPYELYLDNKWDWDVFIEMMKTYTENNPDTKGIAGWWANAFVFTSGETMVTYDGSTYTNNLRSAAIERAQLAVEEIVKYDLVRTGWYGGESAFVTNDLLFYGMGTWAYNAAVESMPNDEIKMVPMPSDPNNPSTHYVSNNVNAYMWVKGSEQADVVKTWLNCCRLVNYDDEYTEITKQKWLENNKGWTEETYDFVMEFFDTDKFTPVYDYGYGLSSDMGDTIVPDLYEGIYNLKYDSWVQEREEYYSIVDSEIAVYNN